MAITLDDLNKTIYQKIHWALSDARSNYPGFVQRERDIRNYIIEHKLFGPPDAVLREAYLGVLLDSKTPQEEDTTEDVIFDK